MRDRSITPSHQPLEVWLLASVAFVLPTMEAPKNILLGVWVIVWILTRLRDGDWGGRWNGWDTVIAAWMASVLLAAAFSATTHSEWRGCRDAARYMAVLWLLTRSNYDENGWRLIYGALIVSVIVAVIWGLAALGLPHDYMGVQLNSVGHVNDSMTYVAICFGVVLANLAVYWRALSGFARASMIVGAAAMLVAVAIAGSRAAAVSVMVLALGFGALWLGRSRLLFRCALVGVVFFAVSIVGLDTDMWRKQEMLAETSHPVLGPRYPIWNQALLEWRMHPLLGMGNGNFSQLSDDEAERWLVSRGEPYSSELYAASPHAHSLYLNALAERGLIGLGCMLALLGAFAASLSRNIPRHRDPALHWLLWSGAASGFVVTAGIGIVNTTLHSETGILATLLIGSWIGYHRLGRPAARTESSPDSVASAGDLKVASRATL